MNIVIMGVQGSGKGTQAKKLAELKGWKHINIGQLFRAEMSGGTATGKEAKQYVTNGELVPDELTFRIFANAAPFNSSNLILDGFPRSVAQSKYLLEHYQIDKIIVLDLSEAEAVKRISARRNCSKCGRDYNTLYKKPQKEGICDVCGGELVTREDDKPKEVQRRIDIYMEQARKLLDFFEGKVKIVSIDASQGIDEIFSLLVKEVDSLQ
ncbi:MAG: nucleoside monophosphate kinase [Candidatus Cloacimonetes bacterium]|nr:nucleoside monophosphate kinase [Candidatus Cloacimonadota bacterium]